MGNTTFSGPVRSQAGFQSVSKDETTGAISVNATWGTGSQPPTMVAGTGITAGTGTVHGAMVEPFGNVVRTTIVMDLTGLNCGGTADDIIGVNSAANCHIGQITAAVNGTIFAGYMTCLEAPTTGDPDIDIWAAAEATGAEDSAISALTSETKLVDSGDLTLGSVDVLTAFPEDGEYLYLTCGVSTAGTYDAGKIEIVLYGTL